MHFNLGLKDIFNDANEQYYKKDILSKYYLSGNAFSFSPIKVVEGNLKTLSISASSKI